MTEPGTSPSARVMDIQEILQLLPHRFPFLLIDRVLEVEPKQRILCLKNVSVNEPHFAGHFPDYPLMPGVLIVEAIAQAGGLLLLNEIPDRADKLMVFTGIDGAKFRRPVVPGDQLKIEVKVLQWRSRAVKMQGIATVDGKVACEATVMCQLVPRPRRGAAQEHGAGNREQAAAPATAAAEPVAPPVAPAPPEPAGGAACQPDPFSESNALPEAAV